MTQPQEPDETSSALPILAALVVVVLVVIGIAVSVWAGGSTRTDEQQVVRAAIGQNDALQRADYPDFRDFTCVAEQGNEPEFLARQHRSTQTQGPRYVDDVNHIVVDGDAATATVIYHFEKTPDDTITAPTRFVREDGAWKVCAPSLAGYATLTHVSYAGDITPQQAWELLADNPAAVLIDVRTDAEWRFVGVPDLSSLHRDVVYLEWNDAAGRRNENFSQELAARVPAGPAVFLCRSGNRSIPAAAAATAAGIEPAYNVLDGFEGNLDEHGHRGGTGWRAIGLPWKQS